MTSSLKPMQLISPSGPAPNPWKVAIVLDELNLPWELVLVTEFFKDVKKEPFTKLNPNGRVPAFVDPNRNNLIVWESGAIIEYLIDTYDTEHKLSSSDPQTKYFEKSLLHFQMSGQGPYFGQVMWFGIYHPEKLPSAIDRYLNEADRVTMVLDSILQKSSGPWLTGENISYADLAFVPWFLAFGLKYEEIRPGFKAGVEAKYPAYAKWWKNISTREKVAPILDVNLRMDYSSYGNKTIEDLAKEMGL